MGSNETKDEQELLARLQSQFGDLDVGGMLLGKAVAKTKMTKNKW